MSFDKQNSEGEKGRRRRGAERLFPLFPFSPLLRRIPWLLFLLFGGLSVRPAEEAPLSEYQVKSALLLNFVRYSDWPATAFATPASPYVVGIVGRDPFGKDLEKAFERKTVKGRPFVLKRVSGEHEMRACHLLFVSSSERRRSRELLEKISDAPVLTVGDFPDFLDHGGMINFLIKDGTVRFEINLEPARGAALKLDANLLKVGVSVRGKP
jgi:hypothetical protein